MSLAEAVDIALAQNLGLMRARADVRSAHQDVKEAWSTVYPRLDANASYTRQFDQLNPFAGTNAADAFFGGVTPNQFLLDNEVRAAQGLPERSFIQYQTEVLTNQAAAQNAAGISVSGSDNPFLIQNRFGLDLTLTQVLYDASAFAAVKGAKALVQVNEEGLEDLARRTVRDVTTAYYGVLLAQAQADVLRRSEERLQVAVTEAEQRVAQGLQPQIALLSAEVDLANTQTERLRAERNAENAMDRLRQLLAIPNGSGIELQDDLQAPEEGAILAPDLSQALARAYEKRPDLEQARLQEYLGDVEAKVEFGNLWPRIEAFFILGLIGQVPDNMNTTTQPLAGQQDIVFDDQGNIDPSSPYDPTVFEPVERGFFNGSFWGPNIQGGIRLTWNLFNGLANYARLERAKLSARKSRYQRFELESAIRADVAQQVRSLESAVQQLRSQLRNVERAELSYEHTSARVAEGVSSQVELRSANNQLDQSRLNQLQAIHDYRVAEVSFLVATGEPPFLGEAKLEAELADPEAETESWNEAKEPEMNR